MSVTCRHIGEMSLCPTCPHVQRVSTSPIYLLFFSHRPFEEEVVYQAVVHLDERAPNFGFIFVYTEIINGYLDSLDEILLKPRWTHPPNPNRKHLSRSSKDSSVHSSKGKDGPTNANWTGLLSLFSWGNSSSDLIVSWLIYCNRIHNITARFLTISNILVLFFLSNFDDIGLHLA